MTATLALLNSVGVQNDHGFFNGADPAGQVWIGYNTSAPRSPVGSWWAVYRRGYKTDPKGDWYRYGNKAFSAYGRADRAPKLAAAQAWAGERYGIQEWKRTPFGSYGDAAFVTARLAELKAEAKAKAEAAA